jgi:hypothetical protein
MKQLVEARLVTRDQRGKWAYYRIVPGYDRAQQHPARPGRLKSGCSRTDSPGYLL